jgi:mono/diheme cytochrome c family protein
LRIIQLALVVLLFASAFSLSSYAQHKPDPVNGEKLYAAFNCSMCHANGGNSVNAEKPLKGPKFLKRIANDGALAKMIRTGSPGTAMKGFNKDDMSDDQLADIIAYIRTLSPADAGPKKGSDPSGSKTGKSGANKKVAPPPGKHNPKRG